LSTLLSGSAEGGAWDAWETVGTERGRAPYLDHVGRDSFYGFLASHRAELFHDEDFTDLYCSDNGRPSVHPSLLATALLLQAYEGASDEEAKARADFDLRWKVALGVGLEERLFAKSTLQLFRARLIIHERVRTLFQKSLTFARHTGYFRTRRLKVVLDTTYVLGERRRFDGHKAQVAVDPESQLITAADVLAGNAPDHERALELVEQAEANADFVVDEAVGDCACGSGETRKTFAEIGRRLVANVATRRGGVQFPKEDFRIDLEAMSCICPAGHKTRKVVSISSADRYGAPGVPLRAFRFDAAICDVCPLRPSCMRARPGKDRVVMIHPQEALLQEARAFQQSEAFAPYRKLRQVAEHRLARLMQLGVRQARYFGRTKTLFQLLMAATVASLTLVATGTGLMRDRNHPRTIISIYVRALLAAPIANCSLFAALLLDPRLRNHTRSLSFRPCF
jgi:hypothetical protein